MSWADVRFLKMSFMVHCDFDNGYRNQHFQSTLLVGRERSQKESTLCTLLKMFTVLDETLYNGKNAHAS